MKQQELTIGGLARAAGINVETVRYYQRLGLIEEPPKPREGYRRYAPSTVDRIVFIKRAKKLGFTLKEIAELLELGDGNCSDVRARAEEKRAQVKAQVADLQLLCNTLDALIDECLAGREDAHCPIVESLTGSGEASP